LIVQLDGDFFYRAAPNPMIFKASCALNLFYLRN
jgi:hypothetical protein